MKGLTMKRCPRCEQEKNSEEFNKNKRTKDGLAGWCRECMKSYKRQYRDKRGYNEGTKKYREDPEHRAQEQKRSREHYHNNKQYRENTKARSREMMTKKNNEYRDWLYTLKTACVICGESDPAVIDFHYIDPATKSFTVGHGGNHSISKDKIIDEIGKCICICANDHRRLHLGLVSLPQEHLKD